MMYQFNRKADIDVLKELCKNRNTVIDDVREDGTILVRVVKAPEARSSHINPCAVCPLFCSKNGICAVKPNLK